MAIQYTGTGGINIFGCASVQHYDYYNYLYGENSIVFLRYKAIRGVLEKIAIKKVILKQNIRTYGKIVPLYQDNLNAYYNEEELCTHQEAVDLAIIFYENAKANALSAIRNC
jgi:hypothetical protein